MSSTRRPPAHLLTYTTKFERARNGTYRIVEIATDWSDAGWGFAVIADGFESEFAARRYARNHGV